MPGITCPRSCGGCGDRREVGGSTTRRPESIRHSDVSRSAESRMEEGVHIVAHAGHTARYSDPSQCGRRRQHVPPGRLASAAGGAGPRVPGRRTSTRRSARSTLPERVATAAPRISTQRRDHSRTFLWSHKNVTVTFLRRPDGRAGDEGGGPGRSPRACETADGRTATGRPEAEDRVGADRARRMRGRSSVGSGSARRGSHAARRGANNTRRTALRATRRCGVHRRRESANQDVGREHQDHRRRSPGHGTHHYCR
ncbi:Uncharacterised protein [Rhodococcus gordoniae]|uniref:Uncharacterized protein n=1 Tax=Rhodococcus gordoniae TaxID=223392 RepID=A0A379LVS9_9NOCA|nr:Uncharacterised protein [Rhodococcus gordoniae]